MKRALLLIIVGALYVLHQDFWFWREARPLVFGFLPIGLFYHACYTLATALVMWLLVKQAWPSHLEEGWGEERRGDEAMGRGGEGGEERRGGGARGRGGDAAMERRGDAAMGSPVVPSPGSPRRRVAPSPLLPIPRLPIPPHPIPLLAVPPLPVASDKGGTDQ